MLQKDGREQRRGRNVIFTFCVLLTRVFKINVNKIINEINYLYYIRNSNILNVLRHMELENIQTKIAFVSSLYFTFSFHTSRHIYIFY